MASTETPDLYAVLVPNEHHHIPKGKAAIWGRHFLQQQKHVSVPSPIRPQTSDGSHARLSSTHAPVCQNTPVKSLVTRCKSAGPLSSPRLRKISEARPVASTTSSAIGKNCGRCERVGSGEWEASDSQRRGNAIVEYERHDELPLNVNAREHLELKACVLARIHRINVDSIQCIRSAALKEVTTNKAKQLVAPNGVFDDGSFLHKAKHKTAFLLRHFFALGDSPCTLGPTHESDLMYDIVDEWACRDSASVDDIAALWKSIDAHIEHSYILRQQLVSTTNPDRLSITIAVDCLRKLPAKIPTYQRVLDVIISLVESGLYLPVTSLDTKTSAQKQFYFERCQELQQALDDEVRTRQARDIADAHDNALKVQTLLQKLQRLLCELDEAIQAGRAPISDKETLLLGIFQSDVDNLLPSTLHCIIRECFGDGSLSASRQQVFYSTWLPQLQDEDVHDVLTRLMATRTAEFQSFLREDFDAIDKLLTESTTSIVVNSKSGNHEPSSTDRISTTSHSSSKLLFQELVERHPTQFTAILWASPFLTAHIFQNSHHLVGRILEQNIVVISHVLQQRPDVLSALLNHTLRDSTAVVEDFLSSHPKALSDLLLNKASAVSLAVKSYPSILADMLQVNRPTLAKVLLSMPDLLAQLFKSTPDLLAQTIREDLTILPLAFSVVPQCLCDALERHPEYFVDVAHRKPALVAKLFAKYPDLLLEPLEANPSVFSNFLVYHRKVLPDFTNPSFDPNLFQFERKHFVDNSQQTEKRLYKHDGKFRLREKLKIQEDSQLFSIRQTGLVGSGGGSSPSAGGRSTPSLGGERQSIKDPKAVQRVLLPTPGQVICEIARLYVKKINADAIADSLGKRRQVLVDYVLDVYIQELEFKRKAHKKLAVLLAGAKQAEQESLRVKWFLRFMNASSPSSPTATGDSDWSFHPSASGFYLAALGFLLSSANGQLQHRLEEELLRPCLVGYTPVKLFLEDPIMSRMLPMKDQRQVLLSTICEKESVIHGSVVDSTLRPSSASVITLHLEDVLESFMLEWIQYQERVRCEWTMQFQLINPDGSGVVRFNVLANLVRSKMSALDDQAILKIYHQCGEENDLGEYFIAVDDFSLAMSILQEQDVLCDFSARHAPKIS